MDINQIIEAYLNSLSKEERENTHIERYSFGNTPEMEDELAQLVAEGEKKATTSLLALFSFFVSFLLSFISLPLFGGSFSGGLLFPLPGEK